MVRGAVVCAVLWGCSGADGSGPQVVRGEIPPPGQSDERVGSTVGLTLDAGSLFCSGVLIAADMVLTAGHCVTGLSRAERMYVALGRDLRNRAGNLYLRVREIAVHPRLDISPQSISWDLALVRMDPLPEGTPYRPARLYDGTLAVGARVAIAGYGETEYQLGDSGVLHQQWTRVARLAGGEGTGPTDFVLASGDGVDTCFRDSGGPVFVPVGDRLEIAGITSWGDGCGVEGHYTDLRLFRDWISEALERMD